jgi:HK97 family phage prohead protease
VFAQSIKRAVTTKRGWPLMYHHQMQGMPIGMVSAIQERDDGPWATSKISRTSLGDDIIELVRDGAIPGVSVQGTNIKSRRTPAGVIQRAEVAVTEISLTPFPMLIGADEMVLRARQAAEHERPALIDLSAYLGNLTPP